MAATALRLTECWQSAHAPSIRCARGRPSVMRASDDRFLTPLHTPHCSWRLFRSVHVRLSPGRRLHLSRRARPIGDAAELAPLARLADSHDRRRQPRSQHGGCRRCRSRAERDSRCAPSRSSRQLRVAPSELDVASRALDVATRAQAAPRGRARRTSAQAERDWRCGARRRAAWRALRLESPCLLSHRVSFPHQIARLCSICWRARTGARELSCAAGRALASAVGLARARRLDHTAKLRSTLAQHFRRVRPLARPPRALSIPLRRPELRRAGRASRDCGSIDVAGDGRCVRSLAWTR